MIRSCITVSLVEEARGGPFVFWDGLEDACRRASELGFDAIEIFPPSAEAIDAGQLRQLLDSHGLQLAALGTGAGWVRQRMSLTDQRPDQRAKAQAFVRSIVDAAEPFHASAIIGSMQGRWGDGGDRQTALQHLAESLELLGQHAKQHDVPLIYEPLNRYETNLCNTIDDGVRLLESLSTDNVVLLADLFHMNIEEADIATALRRGGRHIGHVHFVDSNRRPAGFGHIDYSSIVAALDKIGYAGFLSAEAFPYPDSQEAARQTMESFEKYFR